MIILKIFIGCIAFAGLVYLLSRIATRGALTEIEDFFKEKKNDNIKH